MQNNTQKQNEIGDLSLCFRGFLAGNIHKKCHNCKKSGSNLESGNVFGKINHSSSSSFSSVKTPSFQKSIAPIKLKVKSSRFWVSGIATVNTTTKLEQTAENIFSWAFVMANINNSLTREKAYCQIQ